MKRIVAEGLIATEAEPMCLIGGRRRADGKILFPMPDGAEAALYEPCRLSTRGQLWSWTVQRFRPKPPYRDDGREPFEPYVVGYVELPGEVIVESRIAVDDPSRLSLGMAMDFTTIPVWHEATGEAVHSYAFTPAEGGE